MFPATQRSLALSVFAAAPFTGPTLGPVVGGFVDETVGWRWLEAVMTLFTFSLWIVGAAAIPETYAPLLLRKRAVKMSQETGQVYGSKLEVGELMPSLAESFKRAEKAALSEGATGAAPEARLPPRMIGSVCIPIGLFLFAWTSYHNVHWIVSVIFTAPFGFGMVLLFLSVTNYLIDAYTIYAAMVLAANSVLRSMFGATFPLFTTYMYDGLGTHWASSIPAFLALACVPFPFLFYKCGLVIRMRCKYARAAAEMMEQLQRRDSNEDETKGEVRKSSKKSEDVAKAGREVEGLEGEGVEAATNDRLDHEKDLKKGHAQLSHSNQHGVDAHGSWNRGIGHNMGKQQHMV
ncbi:MAG: hypothetical protein Q9184_002505 [Pyrenodesmia sp. 2 TL-2023]